MKRLDIGALVVAATILLIGILIGSFWLSGIAEPISKLSATIGSIATALTLVFLVYQNNELRKRQDKQQSQQDTAWEEQREMLHFQKYQEHKKAFFSHLSYIEETSATNIMFRFKDTLYEKLFPKNNFEYCKCHIQDVQSHDYLQEIIDLVISIDDNFNSSSIEHLRLFENVHTICNELSLSIKTDEQGTIELGKDVQIDFFTPNKSVDLIKHVIVELISFTKAPTPHALCKRQKSTRYEWKVVQIELLKPLITTKFSNFTINGIDNSDQQMFILLLASYYLNQIEHKTEEQLKLFCNLFPISFSRDQYINIIPNKNHLNKLLNSISNEFRILSESSNDKHIKEQYFMLSKAARLNTLGQMVPWDKLPKNEQEGIEHMLEHGIL